MVRVSIIIPTYNEERYLPKLLRSIKKQTFKDYEVIVVDSHSRDKTVQIARKHGAKVFFDVPKGRRSHPGHARNYGAKKAKGDILVFIDADVVLSKNVIKKIVEAVDKGYVAGTTKILPLKDGSKLVYVLYSMSELFSRLTYRLGLAYWQPMFIKKDVFFKLKGFNEQLQFNEDHDLMRRVRKYGKMAYLRPKSYVSTRRFKGSDLWKPLKSYLGSTFWYLLTGKVPKKYKFIPAGEQRL